MPAKSKSTSLTAPVLAAVSEAPRLPVPAESLGALDLDPATWKVLTDMIFPTARTPEGILMAVRYCRARNLDVLKRPVHVVPMWSTALGREVETVWPGIAEVQITAARTGQWAGMDAPRFGPDRTRTFQGRIKRGPAWEDVAVTLSYPEWIEVTVYRLVNGRRCAFTEPVFWEESYARAGGRACEVPTDMWIRRPRGQALKCAKAASLRAAFPEEASYTAEEMAGKVLESDGGLVHEEPLTRAPSPPEPDGARAAGAAAATPGQPGDAAGPPAEPAADPPAAVLEVEVQHQIARLLARAAAAGAWRQAEEYCRARYQGPHLDYALAEVRRAQAEIQARQAA